VSSQRFTNAFREALWETYNRKCFYCSCELLFAQMEIDHLLPEALGDDPNALSQILYRVGLDSTFCITGFENLVPSCTDCNGNKSNLILPAGSISIHAARIQGRIPALEDALEKRRSEQDLDTTLRFIGRAIENGKYTREELLIGLQYLELFGGGILGHAPGMPAPSPEWPKYGQLNDKHGVIFTEHALKAMSARDITVTNVARAIHHSVRLSRITAQRSTKHDGAYVVRGQNNLRIVFRFDGSQIVVTSVFWKDKI